MTILLVLLQDVKNNWRIGPVALGVTAEDFKAKVADEACTWDILLTTTEERIYGAISSNVYDYFKHLKVEVGIPQT